MTSPFDLASLLQQAIAQSDPNRPLDCAVHAEIASTLVRLGLGLADGGDMERASRLLQAAIDVYLRLGEEDPLYKSLAVRARVVFADELAHAGDLPHALEQYQLAWTFYEELAAADEESRIRAAEMRLRVGCVLAELRDIERGLQHLNAVRDEFKALHDERPDDDHVHACLAATDMSCADYLSKMGNLPEAARHCELALDAFETLSSTNATIYRPEAGHARLKLGEIRLREGKLPLALAELRAVLNLYELLPRNERALANSARARTFLMNALAKHGDLTESMEQCPRVLACYDALLESGGEKYRVESAQAGVEVGMVFFAAGELTSALQHHERSLEVFERLLPNGAERHRESAAEVHLNLGTILDSLGNPAAAERQYRAALDDYQKLRDAGQRYFRGEYIKARIGLSLALSNQGDFSAGLTELYAVLHEHEQSLAEGGPYRRDIVASLHLNIGALLLRQGNTRTALTHLTTACNEFDALIAAGYIQFRTEAAKARANLGVVFVHEKDFPEAQRHLRTTLALYESLISAGGAQYRGTAAHVRSILGSSLLYSGDISGAITELSTTLAAYESRVASGFVHERDNVMQTHLTLGDARRLQGEFSIALDHYRAAAAIASSLYDAGHTQLLGTKTLAARLRLGVVIELSKRLDGREFDVSKDLAEISGEIDSVAAATAKIGDERVFESMKDIYAICNVAWQSDTDGTFSSRIAEELRTLAPHALAAWLALAYRLLGDGRPTFLAANRTTIDSMISAGLVLAVTARHASQCSLLDWVIHTQGLRAQRDLLNDTTDPQLQALATLWNQIDQFDRVALGQEAERVESTDTQREARREALFSSYRERDALVTKRDRLRELLAREGRLPALDALTRNELLRHLVLDEELWLLLRLRSADEIHLIVVRVQAPLPGETQLRESFMLHAHGPGSAPTWTAQLREIERLFSTQSRSTMRRALESAPPATGPDVDVLTAELWTAAGQLLPVLRDAKKQMTQLRCLHLVPLGEAHALPWANALCDRLDAENIDLRVRQYPSVLAWMRARAFATERVSAQSLRPAIAHDDAKNMVFSNGQSAYLPMVELEMAWSRALWERASVVPVCMPGSNSSRPSWPPVIDAARPVQALIGMGHGGAPNGNWARSGLWMPGWPDDAGQMSRPSSERYLSAAHLPALSHVERVVMSCCVLGRTDDQLGEPLGLLAQAFSARTRVAIGSLLPVDDGCAMFVSLAFQWRAIAAGPAADWVEEFQALRRDFMAGRWPDGFADWFQRRLAEALALERDPSAPWVCTLARMINWRALSDRRDERAAQWQYLKAELPAALMHAVPVEIRKTAGWFVAFG